MLRPYQKGNALAPSWQSGRISLGEFSELGWSSRLCTDEDSNHCGWIGIGSSGHPRCLEQRHERKEVRGNGRDHVQSVLPAP